MVVDSFVHSAPERERSETSFVVRELGRILQVTLVLRFVVCGLWFRVSTSRSTLSMVLVQVHSGEDGTVYDVVRSAQAVPAQARSMLRV